MKVLFLTHRLPYAPNRGDRVRAFHIARTLARRVTLHLVSLAHDDDEMAEADRLRELGITVTVLRTSPMLGYLRAAVALAGRRPLTHCLLDAPGLTTALNDIARVERPDVVLAYCSGMARFAMQGLLAGCPLVFDMVDVDSEKWASLGRTAAPPMRWVYQRESRCLSAFEAEATRRADTTLVVNARERDTLTELVPGARIHVLENGVDLEALRPSGAPTEMPRVVFCGVMDYIPNVEGVLWFVEHVWPLVRAVRPDAVFTVVGSRPTPAIQKLANSGAGIDVTGTVPDVRDYLWSSAVSVAPLLTARGLQNKVLEALAAGVPCLVTEAVYQGLPARAIPGCRVASSPTEFAEELLSLLARTGEARRELAALADLDSLGWDSQLGHLTQIIEHATQLSA